MWSLSGKVRPGIPGFHEITPLRKDSIGGHPLRWWSGGGSVESVELFNIVDSTLGARGGGI